MSNRVRHKQVHIFSQLVLLKDPSKPIQNSFSRMSLVSPAFLPFTRIPKAFILSICKREFLTNWTGYCIPVDGHFIVNLFIARCASPKWLPRTGGKCRIIRYAISIRGSFWSHQNDGFFRCSVESFAAGRVEAHPKKHYLKQRNREPTQKKPPNIPISRQIQSSTWGLVTPVRVVWQVNWLSRDGPRSSLWNQFVSSNLPPVIGWRVRSLRPAMKEKHAGQSGRWIQFQNSNSRDFFKVSNSKKFVKS